MDLTLRDGVNLQDAISSAKQIDEQSKAAGFYQEALDHVARQGYGNASFEVGGEEGLDIVEEFYTDDSKLQQQPEPTHDLSHVQDIQKGLQQSVQALNWLGENVMDLLMAQSFQMNQIITVKDVMKFTSN